MYPGHLYHNNEKTWAYTERWPNLLRLSGADCRQAHHIAHGGINADMLPEDDSEFLNMLRSKKHALIG